MTAAAPPPTPPETLPTGGNGTIENAADEEKGIFAQFLEDPSEMPATVAQQIFSIVPGIFGGIGGFVLATRLAKVRKVKTKGVLIASGVVALLTLGAIFLIVEADEVIPVEEEESHE